MHNGLERQAADIPQARSLCRSGLRCAGDSGRPKQRAACGSFPARLLPFVFLLLILLPPAAQARHIDVHEELANDLVFRDVQCWESLQPGTERPIPKSAYKGLWNPSQDELLRGRGSSFSYEAASSGPEIKIRCRWDFARPEKVSALEFESVQALRISSLKLGDAEFLQAPVEAKPSKKIRIQFPVRFVESFEITLSVPCSGGRCAATISELSFFPTVIAPSLAVTDISQSSLKDIALPGEEIIFTGLAAEKSHVCTGFRNICAWLQHARCKSTDSLSFDKDCKFGSCFREGDFAGNVEFLSRYKFDSGRCAGWGERYFLPYLGMVLQFVGTILAAVPGVGTLIGMGVSALGGAISVYNIDQPLSKQWRQMGIAAGVSALNTLLQAELFPAAAASMLNLLEKIAEGAIVEAMLLIGQQMLVQTALKYWNHFVTKAIVRGIDDEIGRIVAAALSNALGSFVASQFASQFISIVGEGMGELFSESLARDFEAVAQAGVQEWAGLDITTTVVKIFGNAAVRVFETYTADRLSQMCFDELKDQVGDKPEAQSALAITCGIAASSLARHGATELKLWLDKTFLLETPAETLSRTSDNMRAVLSNPESKEAREFAEKFGVERCGGGFCGSVDILDPNNIAIASGKATDQAGKPLPLSDIPGFNQLPEEAKRVAVELLKEMGNFKNDELAMFFAMVRPNEAVAKPIDDKRLRGLGFEFQVGKIPLTEKDYARFLTQWARVLDVSKDAAKIILEQDKALEFTVQGTPVRIDRTSFKNWQAAQAGRWDDIEGYRFLEVFPELQEAIRNDPVWQLPLAEFAAFALSVSPGQLADILPALKADEDEFFKLQTMIDLGPDIQKTIEDVQAGLTISTPPLRPRVQVWLSITELYEARLGAQQLMQQIQNIIVQSQDLGAAQKAQIQALEQAAKARSCACYGQLLLTQQFLLDPAPCGSKQTTLTVIVESSGQQGAKGPAEVSQHTLVMGTPNRPPAVRDSSVSPATVRPADRLTFSASVADPEGGGIASVRACGDSACESEFCKMSFSNGRWSCKAAINRGPGLHRWWVEAADSAGSRAIVPSDAMFEVAGEAGPLPERLFTLSPSRSTLTVGPSLIESFDIEIANRGTADDTYTVSCKPPPLGEWETQLSFGGKTAFCGEQLDVPVAKGQKLNVTVTTTVPPSPSVGTGSPAQIIGAEEGSVGVDPPLLTEPGTPGNGWCEPLLSNLDPAVVRPFGEHQFSLGIFGKNGSRSFGSDGRTLRDGSMRVAAVAPSQAGSYTTNLTLSAAATSVVIARLLAAQSAFLEALKNPLEILPTIREAEDLASVLTDPNLVAVRDGVAEVKTILERILSEPIGQAPASAGQVMEAASAYVSAATGLDSEAGAAGHATALSSAFGALEEASRTAGRLAAARNLAALISARANLSAARVAIADLNAKPDDALAKLEKLAAGIEGMPFGEVELGWRLVQLVRARILTRPDVFSVTGNVTEVRNMTELFGKYDIPYLRVRYSDGDVDVLGNGTYSIDLGFIKSDYIPQAAARLRSLASATAGAVTEAGPDSALPQSLAAELAAAKNLSSEIRARLGPIESALRAMLGERLTQIGRYTAVIPAVGTVPGAGTFMLFSLDQENVTKAGTAARAGLNIADSLDDAVRNATDAFYSRRMGLKAETAAALAAIDRLSAELRELAAIPAENNRQALSDRLGRLNLSEVAKALAEGVVEYSALSSFEVVPSELSLSIENPLMCGTGTAEAFNLTIGGTVNWPVVRLKAGMWTPFSIPYLPKENVSLSLLGPGCTIEGLGWWDAASNRAVRLAGEEAMLAELLPGRGYFAKSANDCELRFDARLFKASGTIRLDEAARRITKTPALIGSASRSMLWNLPSVEEFRTYGASLLPFEEFAPGCWPPGYELHEAGLARRRPEGVWSYVVEAKPTAGDPFAQIPAIQRTKERVYVVTNPGGQAGPNSPVCVAGAAGVSLCKTCMNRRDVTCTNIGNKFCTGTGHDDPRGEDMVVFETDRQPLGGWIQVIGGEVVECTLNGNPVISFSLNNHCGVLASAEIPGNLFVKGKNVLHCTARSAGDTQRRGFKLSSFYFDLPPAELEIADSIRPGRAYWAWVSEGECSLNDRLPAELQTTVLGQPAELEVELEAALPSDGWQAEAFESGFHDTSACLTRVAADCVPVGESVKKFISVRPAPDAAPGEHDIKFIATSPTGGRAEAFAKYLRISPKPDVALARRAAGPRGHEFSISIKNTAPEVCQAKPFFVAIEQPPGWRLNGSIPAQVIRPGRSLEASISITPIPGLAQKGLLSLFVSSDASENTRSLELASVPCVPTREFAEDLASNGTHLLYTTESGISAFDLFTCREAGEAVPGLSLSAKPEGIAAIPGSPGAFVWIEGERLRLYRAGRFSELAAVAPDAFYVSADEARAYWTEGSSVKSVSLNGTGLRTLASGLKEPLGIAADGRNVYWTEGNEVRYVAKDSSCAGAGCGNLSAVGPELLGSRKNRLWDLSQDESYIYASASGAAELEEPGIFTGMTFGADKILRISKANGSVSVVTKPVAFGPITSVASDAGRVYWLSGTGSGLPDSIGKFAEAFRYSEPVSVAGRNPARVSIAPEIGETEPGIIFKYLVNVTNMNSDEAPEPASCFFISGLEVAEDVALCDGDDFLARCEGDEHSGRNISRAEVLSFYNDCGVRPRLARGIQRGATSSLPLYLRPSARLPVGSLRAFNVTVSSFDPAMDGKGNASVLIRPPGFPRLEVEPALSCPPLGPGRINPELSGPDGQRCIGQFVITVHNTDRRFAELELEVTDLDNTGRFRPGLEARRVSLAGSEVPGPGSLTFAELLLNLTPAGVPPFGRYNFSVAAENVDFPERRTEVNFTLIVTPDNLNGICEPEIGEDEDNTPDCESKWFACPGGRCRLTTPAGALFQAGLKEGNSSLLGVCRIDPRSLDETSLSRCRQDLAGGANIICSDAAATPTPACLKGCVDDRGLFRFLSRLESGQVVQSPKFRFWCPSCSGTYRSRLVREDEFGRFFDPLFVGTDNLTLEEWLKYIQGEHLRADWFYQISREQWERCRDTVQTAVVAGRELEAEVKKAIEEGVFPVDGKCSQLRQKIGEFIGLSDETIRNVCRKSALRANLRLASLDIPNVTKEQGPAAAAVIGNLGNESAFAVVKCDYFRPGRKFSASSECGRLAPGESRLFAVPLVNATKGRWTAACRAAWSPFSDCRVTVGIESAEHAFTVLPSPSNLSIVSVEPPRFGVRGRRLLIRVDVQNRGDDANASVSCDLLSPSGEPRQASSEVRLVLEGLVLPFSVQTVPDVTGLWTVTECTVFKRSSAIAHQTIAVNATIDVQPECSSECVGRGFDYGACIEGGFPIGTPGSLGCNAPEACACGRLDIRDAACRRIGAAAGRSAYNGSLTASWDLGTGLKVFGMLYSQAPAEASAMFPGAGAKRVELAVLKGNRTLHRAEIELACFDPPEVRITSPANGSVLSGTRALTALATDADSVEFLVDGEPIGSDSTHPYSVSWNTAGIGDGLYTLAARACNRAGCATDEIPVEVSNGRLGELNRDYDFAFSTLALDADIVAGELTDLAFAIKNTGRRPDMYTLTAELGSGWALLLEKADEKTYSVSETETERNVAAGSSGSFDIALTNTGAEDNFTVSCTARGWEAALYIAGQSAVCGQQGVSFELPAGGQASASVSASVPDAPRGSSIITVRFANSEGDVFLTRHTMHIAQAANRPPRVNSTKVSSRVIEAGGSLVFTAALADPDGDNISSARVCADSACRRTLCRLQPSGEQWACAGQAGMAAGTSGWWIEAVDSNGLRSVSPSSSSYTVISGGPVAGLPAEEYTFSLSEASATRRLKSLSTASLSLELANTGKADTFSITCDATPGWISTLTAGSQSIECGSFQILRLALGSGAKARLEAGIAAPGSGSGQGGITISVRNSQGRVASSRQAFLIGTENNPPAIQSARVSPSTASPGAILTFSAVPADPENDRIASARACSDESCTIVLCDMVPGNGTWSCTAQATGFEGRRTWWVQATDSEGLAATGAGEPYAIAGPLPSFIQQKAFFLTPGKEQKFFARVLPSAGASIGDRALLGIRAHSQAGRKSLVGVQSELTLAGRRNFPPAGLLFQPPLIAPAGGRITFAARLRDEEGETISAVVCMNRQCTERWCTLAGPQSREGGASVANMSCVATAPPPGNYSYYVRASSGGQSSLSGQGTVESEEKLTSLTPGSTAEASSFVPGHGPEKAVDGNLSTYWISQAGLPQRLLVRLSRPASIGGIGLVSDSPARPKAFDVYAGDCTTFTKVFSEAEASYRKNRYTASFSPASGRCIRLDVARAEDGSPYTSLAEFEAYASATPAAQPPPAPPPKEVARPLSVLVIALVLAVAAIIVPVLIFFRKSLKMIWFYLKG